MPGSNLRGDRDGGDGGGGAAALSGAGAEEDARLLQLAAGQRMNTDARRAVFLAIMGSEDYAEAFDKLNRLPLKVSECLGVNRLNRLNRLNRSQPPPTQGE